MKKDEKGMVALETLIAFVAFLFFIAFMITWINAASMQLRFHQALTRTANDISFYTYALYMVGATDALRGLQQHDLANELGGDINNAISETFSVIDGVSNVDISSINILTAKDELWATVDTVSNNVEQSIEVVERWVDNPADLVQGLLFIGLQTGVSTGLDLFMSRAMAPALFWRNLDLTPDERRERRYNIANVIAYDIEFGWWDFNFRDQGIGAFTPDGSGFLSNSDADEIVVSARYRINLGAFIPFAPLFTLPEHLYVTQTVQTRGWVGDGTRFDRSLNPPETRN